MTNIKDILDLRELSRLIADKRIARQVHPDLPLVIFNYTNRAQFANEWTPEERACRGLITTEDGEIVARGPSKFFNYGQPGAPEVALDDKVWVSRKEDGSLGIGYYYDGVYGIATRGSFASDQAIKATAMLDDQTKRRIRMGAVKGRTEIFEIVYPENRIVLDYKGLEKLIKLGHVGNESGLIEGRNLGVLFGKEMGFEYEMTFAEALALPIADDAEGYVIDVRHHGGFNLKGHIKLKGARYKELHSAIFGLSERRIWEVFGQGLPTRTHFEMVEEFIIALPDELQPWANKVLDGLGNDFEAHLDTVQDGLVHAAFVFGEDGVFEKKNRGDVARFIKENYAHISGPLFSLLDERVLAVAEWAHKQIRPEHKLFRVEDENAN